MYISPNFAAIFLHTQRRQREMKTLVAVVAIQLIYAGYFVLTKVAFDVGMNTFVFVFYRQAVASLFLAPIAIFFEWYCYLLSLSLSLFFSLYLFSHSYILSVCIFYAGKQLHAFHSLFSSRFSCYLFSGTSHSLSLSLYVCMCVYIYIHISLSHSLSLFSFIFWWWMNLQNHDELGYGRYRFEVYMCVSGGSSHQYSSSYYFLSCTCIEDGEGEYKEKGRNDEGGRSCCVHSRRSHHSFLQRPLFETTAASSLDQHPTPFHQPQHCYLDSGCRSHPPFQLHLGFLAPLTGLSLSSFIFCVLLCWMLIYIKIIGASTKSLSFQAALHNPAVLYQHNTVLPSCSYLCKRSCSMEAWLEHKPSLCSLLRTFTTLLFITIN